MKKSIFSIVFAVLCVIAPVLTASATPLYTFDIKVDPKSISPGKTIDINVYLVENRNAFEASGWAGGRLISLEGRVKIGPSTIVSFTPRSEFNDPDTYFNTHDNGLNATFTLSTGDYTDFTPSSGGIPLEVDNSGIVGRSELLLGVMRVVIGPEIPRDDGVGEPEAPEIFEAHFGFKPPFNSSGWTLKKADGSHNGRGTGEKQIVILKPTSDDFNPNGTPTVVADACPADTVKTTAGICGCGHPELDSNNDKVVDCGNPAKISVKDAFLQNEPDLEFIGDNMSVIMEAFAEYEKATAAAKKSNNNGKGGKTPKIEATYEVTAKLRDSKLKCGTVKVESKKNSAKIKTKKLIGGTYDVSYKLVFKEGKKKLGQTSQSPAASADIVNNNTKCPPKKKNK